MAKTKSTVRRLPIKTLRRPAWMVSKEYGTRKRTIYPFKEKRTSAKTTASEHYQEWTSNKNNNCKKKIKIFYR